MCTDESLANSVPLLRVHEPALGERESAALAACVLAGDASGNAPTVRRFEARFADAFSAGHAVATSSGSAALQLAFAAVGVGPGDEVIVPAFTFAPCADMATLLGADVVYVDSDPATFNLTAELVRASISPATRAVLAVHMYGHPCDLDAIAAVCEEAGVVLIEDCAQAIGAAYRGRPVGTTGALACYSFYANKHITTGEGGMVCARDAGLAEQVRWLRDHAIDRGDPRPYHHSRAAWNYRMSAFSAAVGEVQLERLPEFMATRNRTAARYAERLGDLAAVEVPRSMDWCTRHARWANTILLRPGTPPRDTVAAALADRGIQTRPFYHPLHLHDACASASPRLPACEAFAPRGLVLPSGNTLTEASVDRVCAALREVLA